MDGSKFLQLWLLVRSLNQHIRDVNAMYGQLDKLYKETEDDEDLTESQVAAITPDLEELDKLTDGKRKT